VPVVIKPNNIDVSISVLHFVMFAGQTVYRDDWQDTTAFHMLWRFPYGQVCIGSDWLQAGCVHLEASI
jgi:hypothetical protein